MREMKEVESLLARDLPPKWTVSKIKYVSLFQPSCQLHGITTQSMVTYTPMECIKNGYAINRTAEYGSIPSSLTSFEEGDIVMAKVTPCFENGNIAVMSNLSSGIGFGSSELFVFRAYLISTRFLFYWLQSSEFVEKAKASMSGMGGLKRVSPQYIQNAIIMYPDTSEQCRITTFLDIKCAALSALTADIQSQIDTLEQYKRSVITEAVTKGLNPGADMKNSGIEYVGNIPTRWNMHPLYCYFSERKNKNVLGEESNLLSLSYGRVIRKDINSNGGLLPESFNSYNIVEKDDIIIRPTDLQNDKRSLRTGLVREHGIITSAYIALKATAHIVPTYYHYLLHAFDVMKVFYNMGNGVRQGLNFSEFSRLMVFEPSYEEQQSIVAYLDGKCEQIDSVITDKQSQLAALDEYKKSLIFEYVTGKKEVPVT